MGINGIVSDYCQVDIRTIKSQNQKQERVL